MQEVIKLVSVIKTEINALRSDIIGLTKTHAQVLTEEWIDKQQVLTILKISPRKLQTLRDNGKLPYSQIDGKIYYRTADIENLLTQNHYSNDR